MLADLSIWHILILVAVLVLMFGAKRIPEIGASIGKGIKEFKRGLKDETKDHDEGSDASLPPPSGSAGSAPKRLNQ